MSENLFGLAEDIHTRFDALHRIVGHMPEYNDSLDDTITNLSIAFGTSQQGLLRQLQQITNFEKEPDPALGHLIQRPKGGFMRVMLHYLNPSSLQDLNRLCDSWIANKERVSEAYSDPEGHKYLFSMNRAGKVAERSIVEYMLEFGENGPEFLMKGLGIRSIPEFNKLFFENPQAADFCRAVNPKILKFFMQRYHINSVDKLLAMTADEEFTESMKFIPRNDSLDGTGHYADNLVSLLTAFNVYDLPQFVRITQLENTNKVLRKATSNNFNVLFEVAQPNNEDDLEGICRNAQIAENISGSDYRSLKLLIESMGLPKREANRICYDVISHSYNDSISKMVAALQKDLETKGFPAKLPGLILNMLGNEDYVQQNLDTLITLRNSGKIPDNDSTERLAFLMGIMGGFITPELSRTYLDAKSEEERDAVLKSYQSMMSQVLSSDAIRVEDAKLLSEIIFLAYRPTGFTTERIREMIQWNQVVDLTSQISGLKFRKEGYTMHFSLMSRSQLAEFDYNALKKVDGHLHRSTRPEDAMEMVKYSLSKKPRHSQLMAGLLSYILKKSGDDRVEAYCYAYLSDKAARKAYSLERLESLSEILEVIPKEDEFRALVYDIIGHEDMRKVAKTAADICIWQESKRFMDGPEIRAKTRLDEIVKHLERDSDANVGVLLDSEEMRSVSGIELLKSLKGWELKQALLGVRDQIFLGYGNGEKNGHSDYLEFYHNRILAKAGELTSIVRREMRKVQSIRTDDSHEVTAFISKNIGSYYAKAGAEICTANNMGMWKEKRHVHMNIAYKNQIIGNVMLYFEDGRDYVVARGFNPRKDAMLKYDRRSMAEAMVSTVREIAKENGYADVFMPTQTEWHALSNRDGMAKEITGISRKAQSDAQKLGRRSEITDANFYVTEEGGVKVHKLVLLSMVEYG